jgi:hypothetical protein
MTNVLWHIYDEYSPSSLEFAICGEYERESCDRCGAELDEPSLFISIFHDGDNTPNHSIGGIEICKSCLLLAVQALGGE